ncbi:hypothetical protein [Litorivita sp. NS0012-18]|uniref:hypothetical protein n=1 Tax=Litorivita sp. NS0012-18 TaxID=3127655 RepID=UPI003106CF1E
MVHMNIAPSGPDVSNHPHQHAFVLTGGHLPEHPVFGVHMTQYHCEIHKYQIVLRIELEADVLARLNEMRAVAPRDCFVLCNAGTEDDPSLTEMTVPDLASGATEDFTGNIFQGMRPFPAEPDEHFFPWARKYCRPALAMVKVRISRVILWRPFAHHEPQPDHPSYFIWGHARMREGRVVGEAHATNLQTAALATGRFEAPAWGPDYDHIMTLAEPPQWLDPALLAAGVVVSVPAIDLKADPAGGGGIPFGAPFKEGAAVTTLYRGMAPARAITAGPTYFNSTAVCNSPEIDPYAGRNLFISEMPREFWT